MSAKLRPEVCDPCSSVVRRPLPAVGAECPGVRAPCAAEVCPTELCAAVLLAALVCLGVKGSIVNADQSISGASGTSNWVEKSGQPSRFRRAGLAGSAAGVVAAGVAASAARLCEADRLEVVPVEGALRSAAWLLRVVGGE